MAYFFSIYLLLGAMAWLYSPDTAAEDSLWELGVGLGGVNAPLYRGSDQSRSYFAPIPYFVYRGEKLKVGDGAIRGKLFESKSLELDFSVAANLPVPGEATSRQGMPKLAPTLELGPSLDVDLAPDDELGWTLKLPLRLAVSLRDFGRHGITFAPYLNYQSRIQTWRLNTSFGPLFATRAYHDYYYEVAPAYATAVRPEYHSGAGYSGSRITVTLGHNHEKYWLGFFLRIDSLQGAQFLASPLVQQNYAVMGGFAISWIAAKSDARAKSDIPTPLVPQRDE